MTAAYAASVVAFYVFARYRFPLVPFLMLFAAAGLVALPDVVRTRAVPGGMKAAAAIAVTAVIANWPLLNEAWMKAVTEVNLGAALQSEGRLDEAVRGLGDQEHQAQVQRHPAPPRALDRVQQERLLPSNGPSRNGTMP